ncbi:hypothetical protein EMCRGX_G009332 [Ephydatia muelleri]
MLFLRSREGRTFYANWLAFFLLGTINNLPYVIVNSSAKVLATSLNAANLFPLVTFANVALGLFAKGGSAVMTATNYPRYWERFYLNGLLMIIGLLGVAFAPQFWIALMAILVVGCSSSFGESVTLGYLRYYPKEFVNAWSSGTGFAGILGAALYIMFTCIAVNEVSEGSVNAELKAINQIAYFCTLPAVLVYWFAYFILLRSPAKELTFEEHQPLLNDTETERREGCIKPCDYYTKQIHRILHCTKLVLWLTFNLSAVYVFEYIAQGCGGKARPKSEYNETSCPELYASLQLCYQAGVFVSRSSVGLVKIKRVEIFTVLQFINMVVWVLQTAFKFLPTDILPAYMIFVGLLGGASYVNIFYRLRADEEFEEDRELCINVAALGVTIGILLGSSIETGLFAMEQKYISDF